MRSRRERGFLLLGIVTTIVVGSILSGIMVQEWSVIEKRDNEKELLFIQEQYAAAIYRYQKATGSLPTEIKQLEETKSETGAFIRKLYVDPMTPGATVEDWCLLKLGPSGRVTSSCDTSDTGGELGLGTGSRFNLGGSTGMGNVDPRRQQRQGLPGSGGSGIAGVHSKNRGESYDTVTRGESSYDKWWYTYEDYRKDSSAIAIPGLPGQQGPGVGNQPGQQQPGKLGNTPGRSSPTRPNRRR